MRVVINGQERELEALGEETTVAALTAALGLKADRVAVEVNGAIAPRTAWAETPVRDGDRVEVVHFVGGGCS